MSDTETGEARIGCNEPGRLDVSPTARTHSSKIGTHHPLAVLICPRCREESPDRFRFCGYCGSPLTVGAITEERRTVTVLFADLVGFTTLSESLDHEDVARIQAAYFDAVAETVGRYGGRVQKFIGDAAVVLFGIPRVRDDDAHRAVRASLALVSSAEHLAPRAGLDQTGLRIRIGVNTGEVTYVIDAADPQGWRVTGDVVNTASRLQTMAEPGTVLLGELTALAVTETIQFEAVGALQLRGKAVPVRAFRAIGVRAEPSREHALGRLQASTIGRKQELRRLGAALARAFRGQPERWLILAPPGVGKSRLVEEFARMILPFRSCEHGPGPTWWPRSIRWPSSCCRRPSGPQRPASSRTGCWRGSLSASLLPGPHRSGRERWPRRCAVRSGWSARVGKKRPAGPTGRRYSPPGWRVWTP
jgi:class 3 adenylate cyclase